MVERILIRSNVDECKSTQTPLSPRFVLIDSKRLDLTDHNPYRQIIGSLMHPANKIRTAMCYTVKNLGNIYAGTQPSITDGMQTSAEISSGNIDIVLAIQNRRRNEVRNLIRCYWVLQSPDRKSNSGYFLQVGRWLGELSFEESNNGRAEFGVVGV